jgi:pimeloyl-ACP methyl ester carboxylesterase
LAAWVRLAAPGQPVSVYIEGDGLAYDADGFATLDPTPRKALGLTLAGRDPAANVIYLARPCQFIHAPRCHSFAEWTSRRFAEPAVAALDEALSRLVPPGSRINLVGYSGGGALAVLLAARRSDLASLRTVAGNLDPIGVNRFHHATEELAAFDPEDVAPALKALPQRHFVGRADRVVPASFARAFVRAQGPGACAVIVEVDASHEEGWDAAWPGLVRQPLGCPAD